MDVNYDLMLIKEVKKYTMLYNVNAKGFRNTEKKRRIWNTIGQRLNSTGPLCSRRWLSMRGSYKQNLARFARTGKEPTWIYFKAMRFLDKYPTINPKKIFHMDGGDYSNDGESQVINNMDIMNDEDDVCFQLIEEVKNHKLLYDKKNIDYYDFAKRTKAWEKIAERLNKTETACKDRWRSFRDIYLKIRKKYMALGEPHDTIYDRTPTWKYYDKVKFLGNYITINTTNNSDGGTGIEDETSQNEYIEMMEDYDEKPIRCDSSNDSQKQIKNSFSVEDNFKLIEFVKKHDYLYARRWAGQANLLRNQKWNECAKYLNTTVKLCKERWRCLRDQYIKLKRKLGSEDILSEDKEPRWTYFESLTFLNEHITCRRISIPVNLDEIPDSLSSNLKVKKSIDKWNEDEYEDEAATEEEEGIDDDMNLSGTSENGETSNNDKIQVIYIEPAVRNTNMQLDSAVDEEEAGRNADSNMIWNNEIETLECENATIIDNPQNDDVGDKDDVLYLENNAEDNETSSDSLLSLKATSSVRKKNDRNMMSELSEILKKYKSIECTNCAAQKANKTSTSLLFESLALRIHNSQLSDSDVLQLEADIHSYVALKLLQFKKCP